MKHKLIRNNDVHPHAGFNKWLALLITNGVGNMWFFCFLAVFIAAWMLLSKLGLLSFDPYPFALMLLIVGGIFQALAMVAIMVGQNVQAAASDGEPLIVGCTQEAPLFTELAGERNTPLTFVNVRETAGWSSESASTGPKMAALFAAASEPGPNFPFVGLST